MRHSVFVDAERERSRGVRTRARKARTLGPHQDSGIRGTKSDHAAGAQTLASLAGLVTAGALVVLSRGEVVRGLVICALLAAGLFAVVRSRSRRRGDGDRFVGPIALMWLLLTLGPLHSIVRRSVHVAVNSLGGDSIVEVVGFAVVAAWCIVILRQLVPDLWTLRMPTILLALPVLSIASATWSETAAYSFARGLQLLVVALLALTTVAFGTTGGDATEVLGAYFRFFVRAAMVLLVARMVLGPIYIRVNEDNLGRFALIGMHPNLSAFVVAIALIVDVSCPRRLLRSSGPVRALRVGVFCTALFAMHSRTSIALLVGGFATLFLLAARRSPTFRFRSATPVLAAVAAPAIVFWTSIYSFTLRGGDSKNLEGGNGRLELWQHVPSVLHTPFDWMFGLGSGQAQVAFVDELPWAVGAHNSVLTTLIELGLLGAAVYLLLVMRCVTTTVRSALFETDLGPMVAALLVVLVVQSTLADTVAGPSGGLVLVYLLLAVARSAGRIVGDGSVSASPS